MERKSRVDALGAAGLVFFSALLGFNQVAIKVSNGGLQPVFGAGLRSLGAVLCVWLVFRLLGRAPRLRRRVLWVGLASGTFFGIEFILLFTALDLTTIARTSILFYSMPVWSALGAHFLLTGERLTQTKSLGLILAFAGVVVVILAPERSIEGATAADMDSLTGDLCALVASVCWAAILLLAKGTPLRDEPAESQLWWQVCVSAPILLMASAFFGPLLRDPTWLTWASLGFQTVAVVSLGFAFWFWLLAIYPAGSVAAFGFLSPIFGVAFGWLFLGEDLGFSLLVALALVALGLWVINRPAPREIIRP